METAIIILWFLFAFIFDFLPNAKNQDKKYKLVYMTLFSASFVVLILFSFGIIVPGPSEPIRKIIDALIKPSK